MNETAVSDALVVVALLASGGFNLFLGWSIRTAIRELSRSNERVMEAVTRHSDIDALQHGNLGERLGKVADKLDALAKDLAALPARIKRSV